jgi:hypothetical protein
MNETSTETLSVVVEREVCGFRGKSPANPR